MENNSILELFKPKRDVYFDTAMAAANSIKLLLAFKKESFEDYDGTEAIFHKVHQNDPKSPSIYFLDKSQYVIFYPANSTPYAHSLEDKCKFVEVLSGILYDANSDKKLFKGDKLKVFPTDNFVPHTLDQKCVIRVCVGNCNSVWDQICG